MEDRFPEWFSFVRSHRTGRYSSKLNQSGTPESEEDNRSEELLAMGTWWWWLKTTHEGDYSGSAKFDDERIGTYTENAWAAIRTAWYGKGTAMAGYAILTQPLERSF